MVSTEVAKQYLSELSKDEQYRVVHDIMIRGYSYAKYKYHIDEEWIKLNENSINNIFEEYRTQSEFKYSSTKVDRVMENDTGTMGRAMLRGKNIAEDELDLFVEYVEELGLDEAIVTFNIRRTGNNKQLLRVISQHIGREVIDKNTKSIVDTDNGKVVIISGKRVTRFQARCTVETINKYGYAQAASELGVDVIDLKENRYALEELSKSKIQDDEKDDRERFIIIDGNKVYKDRAEIIAKDLEEVGDAKTVRKHNIKHIQSMSIYLNQLEELIGRKINIKQVEEHREFIPQFDEDDAKYKKIADDIRRGIAIKHKKLDRKDDVLLQSVSVSSRILDDVKKVEVAEGNEVEPKRKRGRPPKTAVKKEEELTVSGQLKRRRGRPAKVTAEDVTTPLVKKEEELTVSEKAREVTEAIRNKRDMLGETEITISLLQVGYKATSEKYLITVDVLKLIADGIEKKYGSALNIKE